MVKKRRKPGPRSRHGDGSGWLWKIITGGPKKSRVSTGKPFSLAGAVTRIVNWFWVDANRYERTRHKVTERRRGRLPMSRVHPHRYRRREYKHH